MVAVLAGFAAAFSVRAVHSEASSREFPPFDQIDTNHDGTLSRKEAAAVEGLDFDSADVNQDGRLNRSEYLAAATEHDRS